MKISTIIILAIIGVMIYQMTKKAKEPVYADYKPGMYLPSTGVQLQY